MKNVNKILFAAALTGLLAFGSCKGKEEGADNDTTTTTTTNDMDSDVDQSPIDTIATETDTVISTEGVNTPNSNPVGEQEP